jgi:phosphate transport system protein
MKIHLDEELNKLRKTLLEMGNAVEDAVGNAIKALKEKDKVLAKQVMKNDVVINRLEVAVDKICLKIFALKQPIAIDLRFVASSLKINNDLERMGDLSTRIAEDVIELVKEGNILYLDELFRMTELIQQMVKLCMEGFMQKNVMVATKVIEQDKEVDNFYNQVVKKIGPFVHEDSERFEVGLAIINIAKCLERIGDHAKNICEDTIYLAQGEIVKHKESLEQP